MAGIVRAHSQARRIARQVQERRDWNATHAPIGPPRPDHLPAAPPSPVFNIPRLIPAARLIFAGAPPVTVLPLDRAGWGNLCRILSTGRLRAEKGQCDLRLADMLQRPGGLHLLLWPQAQRSPGGAGGWGPHAHPLTCRFAGRMHLLLAPLNDGNDPARTRPPQGWIVTRAPATDDKRPRMQLTRA